MLDLKFIRENGNIVKDALKSRGSKFDIDWLMSLDEEHRKVLIEVEDLKQRRNKANDEISALIKQRTRP